MVSSDPMTFNILSSLHVTYLQNEDDSSHFHIKLPLFDDQHKPSANIFLSDFMGINISYHLWPTYLFYDVIFWIWIHCNGLHMIYCMMYA